MQRQRENKEVTKSVSTAAVLGLLQTMTPLPPAVCLIVSDYRVRPNEHVAFLYKQMEIKLSRCCTEKEKDKVKQSTAIEIAHFCLELLRGEEQNGVANALMDLTRDEIILIQNEWAKLAVPAFFKKNKKAKSYEELMERLIKQRLHEVFLLSHGDAYELENLVYYFLCAYYSSEMLVSGFTRVEILEDQIKFARKNDKESKIYPSALLSALEVRALHAGGRFSDSCIDAKGTFQIRHATFAGADLSNELKIATYDLSEINLEEAILPDDLTGAKLRDANLRGARSDFVMKVAREANDEDLALLASTDRGLDMRARTGWGIRGGECYWTTFLH